MEIRIFQVVVPLLALLFGAGLIARYRKGKLTGGELIFSVLFWLSVAVFALFPDAISTFVADLFGIKSNVNAIIFLAIGLQFYLGFLLYKELKKTRRQLTELTRKIALNDAPEDCS